MSMVKRGKTRVSGGGHVHYNRYLWGTFVTITDVVNEVDYTHNRVHLLPLEVPYDCTIDRLIFISTNVSNGNINMGLYLDNGDTPAGGDLVVELGSTAFPAGATQKQELTTSYICDAGLYWICWIKDSTNATLARNALVDVIDNGTLTYYYYESVGVVLADPCPAVTAMTDGPILGVRILT